MGTLLIFVGVLIALVWMFMSIGYDINNALIDTEFFIRFKSFLKFYAINPNRWELLYDSVKMFAPDNGWICYKFHFIDYYRYLHFKKKIDKHNQDIIISENYALLIDCVKADIEAFDKKNSQDLVDSLCDIHEKKEAKAMEFEELKVRSVCESRERFTRNQV